MQSPLFLERKGPTLKSSRSESLASKHLHQIRVGLTEATSLADLVERMQHQGFGLIIFILCLPFVQPIPSGGLSAVFGSAILFLGVQLTLQRKTIWLPEFVGKRKINQKMTNVLILAAEKSFAFLEKFVRPRFKKITQFERTLGIAIVLMALLLMLPIPVPFSNTLCAIPILFFAMALIEHDGLLVALGYAIGIVSIIFHGALLWIVLFLGEEAYQRLVKDWFF